jgi:hypothetical protein
MVDSPGAPVHYRGMAKRKPRAKKKPAKKEPRPFIGVATTTQIAFVLERKLFLERMNVLAENGAGVLCETLPDEGTLMPVAFRLSTAKELVRARARVLGHFPTTPAGLALRDQIGERAFVSSMGAAIGDSATAIFRMGDLEAAKPKKPAAPPAPAQVGGFAVEFVEVDEPSREAIRHHVEFSRRLSDKMAARGDHLVSTTEDERDTMAALFDEGDLSKKAMDW